MRFMSIVSVPAFALFLSFADSVTGRTKKGKKRPPLPDPDAVKFNGYAWSEIYTAYPQNPDFKADARSYFKCSGPYALCSYAQCKITSIGSKTEPAIAECVCYGQPKPYDEAAAINIGGVAAMLDAEEKKKNYKVCKEGSVIQDNQVCATANVAPFCADQATKPRPSMYKGLFDIISTYNNETWPVTMTSPGKLCAVGQYTNCFSAGCELKEAWNGANTTCYCPVYNVKPGEAFFSVTNEDAECIGTLGFAIDSIVWNGAGIVQFY